MPLEADIDKDIDLMQASGETPEALDYVTSVQDANLYHYGKFTRGVFVLTARTSKSMAKLFYRLVDCLPQREDETEPMFNLLCWYRSHLHRSCSASLTAGSANTGQCCLPVSNTVRTIISQTVRTPYHESRLCRYGRPLHCPE